MWLSESRWYCRTCWWLPETGGIVEYNFQRDFAIEAYEGDYQKTDGIAAHEGVYRTLLMGALEIAINDPMNEAVWT